MSENDGLKEAVNSFIESMEEDQKRIDSYKVEIDPKFENSRKKEITDKKRIFSLIDENDTDENIEEILKKIIQFITTDNDIEIKSDNNNISIYGKDLSIAIGKNGKNLEAIEYLVNLIAKRKKLSDRQITIDIKDYRKNAVEKLNKMAIKLAEKVIKEQKKVFLKPMPSFERKIIHNALAKIKEVKTKSTNDEPNRRIVIYPAISRN
jgi:spoIIIJ-associated protein